MIKSIAMFNLVHVLPLRPIFHCWQKIIRGRENISVVFRSIVAKKRREYTHAPDFLFKMPTKDTHVQNFCDSGPEIVCMHFDSVFTLCAGGGMWWYVVVVVMCYNVNMITIGQIFHSLMHILLIQTKHFEVSVQDQQTYPPYHHHEAHDLASSVKV